MVDNKEQNTIIALDCSLWQAQFPEFKLDVVIPKGFEDESYRNDVCPHWVNEKLQVTLWIDHKDIQCSEIRDSFKEGRFTLFSHPEAVVEADSYWNYSESEYETALKTNNYNKILEAVHVIETYSELGFRTVKTENGIAFEKEIDGEIFVVYGKGHDHIPLTLNEVVYGVGDGYDMEFNNTTELFHEIQLDVEPITPAFDGYLKVTGVDYAAMSEVTIENEVPLHSLFKDNGYIATKTEIGTGFMKILPDRGHVEIYGETEKDLPRGIKEDAFLLYFGRDGKQEYFNDANRSIDAIYASEGLINSLELGTKELTARFDVDVAKVLLQAGASVDDIKYQLSCSSFVPYRSNEERDYKKEVIETARKELKDENKIEVKQGVER